MALTYYQKTVEPVGQQARYLDFIAQFDFELQYRPGKHHANCGALSRRRPCEVNGAKPANSVVGSYSVQKKLLSLKHSVRARKVVPLKQQKSLCLTP